MERIMRSQDLGSQPRMGYSGAVNKGIIKITTKIGQRTATKVGGTSVVGRNGQ
jgi:hypothetical protein